MTVGGAAQTVTVGLPTNWASKTKGAEATGDGVNVDKLIDDTESTNWASLNSPVAGKSVRVRLAMGAHTITQVRVSAMLHPTDANDPNDSGSQNRFTALRRFAIEACDQTAGPCVFQRIYTSPEDAFPSVIPRPLAPDLIVRTFDIPATRATDVRLVVLSNQCTGHSGYQGEQDDDPANATDCPTASAQGKNVRAAELEVLSAPVTVDTKAGAPAPTVAGGAAGTTPGVPAGASSAGGVAGVAIAASRSVVGAGSVRGAGRSKTAAFRVNVSSSRLLLTWKERGVAFKALKLTSARFAAGAATLRGVGLLNGKRVAFRAVLLDKGTRGDVFRIVWAGKSRGGTLLGGGVTVT
jgi:hypothetical protein